MTFAFFCFGLGKALERQLCLFFVCAKNCFLVKIKQDNGRIGNVTFCARWGAVNCANTAIIMNNK